MKTVLNPEETEKVIYVIIFCQISDNLMFLVNSYWL